MNTPKQKRSFREMLDWLCAGEEYVELWELKDGQPHLNITGLAARISEKTGIRVHASTLYRSYTGTHDSLGDKTVSTLALFFGVPSAVIRDEITIDAITEYGMDITLSEIKLLKELRELPSEGRALVRQTIQTLQELHSVPSGPRRRKATPADATSAPKKRAPRSVK
jgi:hypothetical protein